MSISQNFVHGVSTYQQLKAGTWIVQSAPGVTREFSIIDDKTKSGSVSGTRMVMKTTDTNAPYSVSKPDIYTSQVSSRSAAFADPAKLIAQLEELIDLLKTPTGTINFVGSTLLGGILNKER